MTIQRNMRPMIAELLDIEEGMSDWEIDFIESLDKWNYDFTPKQVAVLERIWNKHLG